MSDKSKICAIGEKKLIDGKWYEKAAAETGCRGCAWKREVGGSTTCEHPGGDTEEPVEEGGTECHNSIWIACDQPQPETPTVEECAGCRFWNRLQARQCRRFPKGEVKQANEWCGEWKA